MANSRKYTTLFNADSSGFKKGVSQMVQALEDANKALVKNQYQQKECSKSISAAQSEIKKLQQIEKEKGQLDEEQTKKLKQLNETIEKEKTTLAQLKTEQVGIKGTITSLSREITDNNSKWTTLKGTIANIASDGIEFLSRKLLDLGKNVISIGEQFSASMSEVGAISGATAEQMELLEKTAREYGATTRFSASEAAQALKYMALAGWDANQSVESLGSVLDLAAAGNMDLAKASDIVTDYITAFGLSAKDSAHFSDVMAYAMSHSNTNVEQLGEAYKNCASTAASMGYNLEEVTAVLMTMANAGVKGGEAGTTLNAIMTRLATDTKGCASELHEMGIEIFDENDNLKSLSEILELVSGAFNGLSDKSDASLAKIIAGQNQYAGFQTILKGLSDSAKEGGQSFADYANALEKCDGVSKGMAKTMSDNLSGDLKTMQSAFEELALKIYEDGETPLRNLVKTITNQGVPAIEKLIENIDKLVPIVVAAGTAFVSYKAAMGITSAVNTLVQTMKALDAATQGAAAAQGTLNAVQAANPAGLVAAALGLLIGGLTSYALIASNSAKETGNLNIETENYLSTLNQMKVKSEESLNVINNLKTTYDELRTSTNLTAEEETKLNSVAESLAETLGISIDALKEKDGTYKDLTKDIDEYIKKLQEQIRFEGAKEGLTEAYKAYDQAKEKALEYYSAVEEQQKKVNKLTEEYNNAFKSDYETNSDREAALRGVKINLETEQKELEKLSGAWGDYYIQASTAAEYIQQYTIDLGGSAEKAAEEFEKNMDVLNGVSENVEKVSKTINKTKNETDELSESIKKAADEAEKSIKQAQEDLTDVSELLQKVNNDIEKQGTISQSTISSIAKKYPELTDKLNDYLVGLTDEKDIIKSLEQIYNTDVNNFKKQIAAKKLDQEGYLKTAAESNANLVNKYKELYDIDLRNFTTAEAAKLAAKKKVQAEYNKLLDEENYRVFQNAYGRQVYGKDSNGKWHELTGNELAAYDRTRQNYFDFDEQDFLNKLASDIGKTYSDITADVYLKTSNSESSSKSKTGSTTATAENTEKNKLDAYLKLIDQKKTLDELSIKSEIASYDYALKVFKATEEQKIDIAKRRYNAEKQLRQQNLTYAQAAYNKLINGKIKEYEDKSKQTQTIADEKIRQIDDAIKKRQQQQDDEKRKKEISDIDDELRYRRNYLTETERNSLLRRKQDILNEQANVNYERNIELKKAQLQEQANNQISKNTLAIERLNAALENAAYYFAKAAGNQTAAQVVNNSTSNQTINYLRQGTSEEEFRRLMKTVI